MTSAAYTSYCLAIATVLAAGWAVCSLGVVSSLTLSATQGREIPGTRFMLGGLVASGTGALVFAAVGLAARIAA